MQPPSNKLPRNVILLGWVSFFADVSSEMIYPLLPIFLTAVLGAPAIALGAIEGTAQALVSVMSFYSGHFSDRSKIRVPFVRWGYGLPILGKLIIAVSTGWISLLVGRLVDRFGKGLRGSPRDALIAEAIEPARRGEAFGYHRMMDTAGAVVGILLAAVCLSLMGNQPSSISYRLIFGFAALLAILSLITSFFVSEQSVLAAEDTAKRFSPDAQLGIRSSLRVLGRDYWTTLIILCVFGFANSSDTFLLLKASNVGLSGLQVVLLYALYNVSYSAFSFPAGKLSDRVGRWRLITIGWVLYSLIYFGISFANSSSIWALFIGYGFYMALTEGVSKALIVDSVPAAYKGTALGILYFCLGLTALSSNLLTGWLWDTFGARVPFWVGSITALLAAVIAVGKIRSEALRSR